MGVETAGRGDTAIRPIAAALVSAVVPGSGHWLVGARRRAALLFLPNLALVALAVVGTRASKMDLLRLAVTPRFLWMLLVGIAAAAVWRLFAVVDAWRMAGGSFRQGLGAGLLVALVVLVVAPHALVAGYDLRTVSLLEHVFVGDQAQPATTTTTTVGTSTTLADTVEVVDPLERARPPRAGLLFAAGVGDPEAAALRTSEVLAPESPPPFLPLSERADVDRITVLLAGGDAGPGRSGLRTDTMIVATLDTTTGKAALFGVPRNFGHVPLPKRFEDSFVDLERRLFPPPTPAEGEQPAPWEPCKCYPGKLNALYGSTRNWRRTFPNAVDPGMEMLRRTLQHLLGLHIDYYALIDMKGFVDLVDAIGGVDTYIDKPLHTEVSPPREGDHWAKIDVDVGWHHLTSAEALAWVRARRGMSDYTRMRRQRCMLKAVAAEFDAYTVFRSFPAIASAIENSVTTNVPVAFLPDLVQAAASLDFDDITTVGLIPPYYAPVRDAKFNAIPDVDRIRSKVRRVLAGEKGSSSSSSKDECGPPKS